MKISVPKRLKFKFVPKKLRSKKALAIFIVLAVVLNFGLRGGPDTSKIKTATVSQKTIQSEVSASGSIKSKNAASLKFGISGKVAGLNFKEGDYVYRGQVIGYLNAEKYLATLRQTQQDVVAADAVLQAAYDDLSKASGAESFQNQIKRTAAEATKNKAFDAMKKAEADLAATALTAPFSGTLTSLEVESGEEVFAGEEIGKIADINNINFAGEVDETEIPKVSVGQKATVKLDAYDEPTMVIVSKIGSQSITTSTGATAYEVTLPIPSDSKFLLGMNGEARIVIGEAQDVLVIPNEAVVDDKYVRVKNGEDYSKKEIRKGLESDFEVQVTDGLSKDQVILVSGFEELGKKSLFQKLAGVFK
ncbi:MAG: efflux RND transporter periplasmic adaptor subunit [Candidatus Curtissbacteria bacterium]|nr:efflux RND transporter periplasmic adaptor subunit [Candidatus Curtissbacteria bacterium]